MYFAQFVLEWAAYERPQPLVACSAPGQKSEVEMPKSEKVRLAAVGDLHCMKDSQGALQKLLAEIPPKTDILLLCGDLTDTGTPEEARVLAKELKTTVNIPIVAVLGNHDYHSAKQQEVEAILSEAGIVILNGEAREIKGIG